MTRRSLAPLIALLALVVPGCGNGAGGSGAWGLPGVRVIREVSADEGLRLLEAPDSVLVQVRDADRRVERVPGTQVVGANDALPRHVTESSATVVILAQDAGEGMRVAARLARAGIQDVAIVQGGIAAWQAARRTGDPEEARGSATKAAEST